MDDAEYDLITLIFSAASSDGRLRGIRWPSILGNVAWRVAKHSTGAERHDGFGNR